VATKIKLMRLGKMRAPYYRVVVADARTKRDGRSIETIGKYHPKEDPSFIQIDSERAAYWLGVGAQPTEAVTAILKVTGDWQRFKGLPAPAPMLVATPKADKRLVFEAAAREAAGLDDKAATTPRGGGRKPKASADTAAAPAAATEPAVEAATEPAAEAATETAAEAPAGPDDAVVAAESADAPAASAEPAAQAAAEPDAEA
jgi:small subunit ribosomal protein S16